MSFIKKFKGAIVVIGIFVIVLATGLYYSDRQEIDTDVNISEPIKEDITIETPKHVEVAEEKLITPTPATSLKTSEPDVEKEIKQEPEEKSTLSCFLTVRCDTLLDNLDSVAPEKTHLIPQSGVILPEIEFEFSEGESAFDVLKRELRSRNIHFEFTKNPMYDSVYIEGIGNLYELDAGNLSGWIYRVNGEILSVGCSEYKLKNGDKIEFLYTCNLGKDL